MTKWLVAAAAIVIFAIQMASPASPSKAKPKPANPAHAQPPNDRLR